MVTPLILRPKPILGWMVYIILLVLSVYVWIFPIPERRKIKSLILSSKPIWGSAEMGLADINTFLFPSVVKSIFSSVRRLMFF